MTLFHAVTTVQGAAAAGRLAETLEHLEPPPTVTGAHDRDDGTGLWEISAYFDGRPAEPALMLLARAHGVPDFAVAAVGTRDWLAQVRAGLVPVAAGRIVVFGSHDRLHIPPNRIGLEIEAALAFGTGHHATTRACLLALDHLQRRGWHFRSMADIGGGTGVLAMAACRLWCLKATAGDIDPIATATARANLAANGLAGRVACLTAAGFKHPRLHAAAPFDLVTANILAAPLKRLAPDMARHVASGGVVILSGILARQAASVERIYQSWGFWCIARVEFDGWTAIVLRRLRRQAGGARRLRSRSRSDVVAVRDPC